MAPTFAALRGEYARLWDTATVTRTTEADKVARRILRDRARYEAVERATGVPWEVVAVLHDRESGGDFSAILHNGERIIGAGRRTEKAPKGRGPFGTWQEAAIDALRHDGLDKVSAWSVERTLYQGEIYNGRGYRMRRLPSPYLWAGTNHYEAGKFVEVRRGGKWVSEFRPTLVDKQLGIAAVMMRLMALEPSVTFARGGSEVPRFGPGTWNSPALKAVQTMLRDKGYAAVGMPDGDWGLNTETALGEFQAANGLPVTRAYDAATAAALPTAPRRDVSPGREAVTSKDLRAAGSGSVIGAWRSKVGAAITGGLGGAYALVEGALGKLDAAGGALAGLRDLLSDVPGWVWGLTVLAVAAIIYMQSRRAERAAVDAVRSGEDAGPVALGKVIARPHRGTTAPVPDDPPEDVASMPAAAPARRPSRRPRKPATRARAA